MLADFKFALRRLRHAPGFTIVAIFTLAVAVGANTAILTIADGVLFRPLPYRDPDRVFLLQMRSEPSGDRYTNIQLDFIRALNDRHQGLGEVGLAGSGPRVLVSTPDGTEDVSTASVSASYFRVLGVTPSRGRVFADADTPGRSAMLSHAAWRARFAGDPAIAGRTVTLGASSFDVVGVLPPGFRFPSVFVGKPDLITLRPPLDSSARGGTFHPIARLEPGVTREQAQAAMAAVVAPVVESDPRLKGSVPYLENIRDVIHPVGRPILRFLLAAAGLVLLVGCANLANMMLARGRRQERETAVRTALGASRLRLIRPLMLEAVMLGFAAASLALLVTRLLSDAMLRQVPASAYGSTAVGVDLRVVIMSLALGVVGGLVFAVVPAWRSARMDVLALIQGRHRAGSAGWRLGRPMIAVQVAVALVLAFGAAVAAKAFVSILQVPLGFNADNVIRLSMQPPPGTTDIAAFYRTVADGLRNHPDVIAAGASGTPPLSGITPWSSIRRPGTSERLAGVVHVSAGYFEAIGLGASSGRLLEPADAPAGQAAVVSSSAARALFGGTDPVGQFISREDGPAWHVVGVVPDFRSTFGDQSVPHVYVIPTGRTSLQSVYARVRARSDAALTGVRREAGRLAPGAPIQAGWWADGISDLTHYKNPRFQTMVLTVFAGLALGLTALGVFGVVAFLVAARSREMGIRLAIGAAPGSLVRLIARQTLVPVGIGLALGLIATRWVARLAEAQLFQVEARDPWMLAVTSAIVLAAALLAAYLPARRAARVDPLVVLRAE